ncbi:MAG TPA: hypothetical protein VIV58_19485 [Kofleriaceae bacterium]
MTDLDRVVGPRDAAVVQLLSRRVEPTFGFVVYGVVYLFLSSFAGVAGGLVAALLSAGLGFGKGSTLQDVIVLVCSLAAWIAAWIPFARWVRRKRDNARSLVREGILCDAVVATSKTDRAAQLAVKLAMGMAGGATNVTWDRVVFEYRGTNYAGVAPFDRRPEQGAPCHVLFHPLAKFSLAFSPGGRAFVTKVHPVT